MNYEKYLIKKDKCDLLSSLKSLDKKIVTEKMKKYDLDSIEELKEYILDKFEFCLEASKDDIYTRMYFERLINHENSTSMSAYNSDIEALWVFVYENGEYYSYYIPEEIKDLIKKKLNF